MNVYQSKRQLISIHAPRTGSDRKLFRRKLFAALISIHAPRTGSDDAARCADGRVCKFQSTLPARGATDGFTDALRST